MHAVLATVDEQQVYVVVMNDSDYEYVITVPAAGLPPLYALLNVKVDDREGLLRAIAKRFHGNRCWSKFGEFLAENNIDHDSFTWA